MDSARQNLRAYYEEEARLRLRKPVTGHRVDLREEFLALLQAERRRSIVEFGAGPGRDGEVFVDAGWSMSTLMHIPEDEVPETLSAMTAPLRPGAPLFVGVWGGDLGDLIGEFGLAGHQRRFSLRTFGVNLRLFAACGKVEHATTWDLGADEWQYQVFQLRVGC